MKRILKWGFGGIVLLTLILFSVAYWQGLIGEKGPQPTCHKNAEMMLNIWVSEHDTNVFPNVNGRSVDSLTQVEWGGLPVPERYKYVPGLHKDDPSDLVLMYLPAPTRWIWHGQFEGKKGWIVVPVDFVFFGQRKLEGRGEFSEKLSTAQFTNRLIRTLNFLRTNERPNWQTVVKEHTAFLEPLNQKH